MCRRHGYPYRADPSTRALHPRSLSTTSMGWGSAVGNRQLLGDVSHRLLVEPGHEDHQPVVIEEQDGAGAGNRGFVGLRPVEVYGCERIAVLALNLLHEDVVVRLLLQVGRVERHDHHSTD